MTLSILLTLITVIGVLITLISTRLAPDLILMSALALLLLSGILTPQEAFAGFGNTGLMTIALLYIVAAGLQETGAIQYITYKLLGQPNSTRQAQTRLILPASLLSAFMNNTAVVAMLIPAVQDWARRIGISASKLLIPLSYAAIMGGTLTLIGTSTNLVIDGLLQQELGIHLGMFEISAVGLAVLLVGSCYLLVFSQWLLPEREGAIEQLNEAREYRVEVEITANSPLIGLTISQAGLRSLNSTYLAEIERQGQLFTSVEPHMLLQAGDLLYFIGAAEGAKELRKINGLQPAPQDVAKLQIAHHQRHLVEAVIGPNFPALGMSIKESRFRTHYKAVILSVSRAGKRLPGKLGNIQFTVGDTLLLEAGQNFVDQYRFRRDFLLLSLLNESTPPDFSKAPLALFLLGALIALSASGLLSILEAALLTAGTMIMTRCITIHQARRAIDLSVLIVIAASFSLGAAMTQTGAAAWIAHQLLIEQSWLTITPWLALVLIYLLTVIFTEMITNNAAAVLMFPIALAFAEQLAVPFMPYAIAIMFGASASFITPLGYQTNLMVYGPGGYRITDYVKLGLPLSLLTGGTALYIIPLIWKLHY